MDLVKGLLTGVQYGANEYSSALKEKGNRDYESQKATTLYNRQTSLENMRASTAADRQQAGFTQQEKVTTDARTYAEGAGERKLTGQTADAMKLWIAENPDTTPEQRAAQEQVYNDQFRGKQFQTKEKVNETDVQALTATILESTEDIEKLAKAAKMTPQEYARAVALSQIKGAPTTKTLDVTDPTKVAEERAALQEKALNQVEDDMYGMSTSAMKRYINKLNEGPLKDKAQAVLEESKTDAEEAEGIYGKKGGVLDKGYGTYTTSAGQVRTLEGD